MNQLNDSDEIRISLKDMCFYILHRWKVIVLSICAAALVCGVTWGMASSKKDSSPDALLAQQQYEDKQKELQEARTMLSGQIELQENNLSKSILMDIDSQMASQAKLDIYIDADSNIKLDNSVLSEFPPARILAAYQSLLSQEIVNNIAPALNMEPWALQELISVQTKADHILQIVVSHPSKSGSAQIMNLIRDSLNSIKAQIIRDVAPHHTYIMQDVETVGKNDDLKFAQQQKLDHLAESKKQLSSLNDQISELQKSHSSNLKKGFIVLLVCAVILPPVIFACAYLFGGKVYSAEELKERCGIKLLGTLAPEKSARGLSLWLKRAEGRITDSGDSPYALTAACINVRRKGCTDILVAGKVNPEFAQSAVQRLQGHLNGVRLTFSGDILADSASVAALAKHDGVILLEQCNTSRYQDIAAEAELIADASLPLLGAVVIDY